MNRFGMLSQEEKMELLELSVAEVFNRGYKYCGMDNDASSFTVIEKKEEKSKNQQRKELIQEAEKKTKFLKDNEGNDTIYWCNEKDRAVGLHTIHFHVNKEKGTVVSIIKNERGRVVSKGIARCMNGDVFNEAIGRYISYRRAIGKNIEDKFLDPVQPDEVVVGMKLNLIDTIGNPYSGIIHSFSGDRVKYEEAGFDYVYVLQKSTTVIADDTNAKY